MHYAAILEWTFGSGTKITLATSLATSLNLTATSLNLMETSLNFENQLNHIWNFWIQCNSTHELAVNLRKPFSTDLTSGNQLNIWSKPLAQDLTFGTRWILGFDNGITRNRIDFGTITWIWLQLYLQARIWLKRIKTFTLVIVTPSLNCNCES